MTFTREELRKLALPVLAALALLAAGAWLVSSAADARSRAQAQLAAAQAERRLNGDRLARIAEEEREVRE